MSRSHAEAGMVTAETAVLAPVITLCLVLGVWIISLAHLQLRLIDASRDAARLVARGEPSASVVANLRRTLPRDARFHVSEPAGGYVTVRVTARARAPVPGLTWSLAARSICVDES